MKLMMILGAIVGFSIGAGFAMIQDSSWPSVLWRACAAALGAGLLLRWWGNLWLISLAAALREKQRQEKLEALAKEEAKAAAAQPLPAARP